MPVRGLCLQTVVQTLSPFSHVLSPGLLRASGPFCPFADLLTCLFFLNHEIVKRLRELPRVPRCRVCGRCSANLYNSNRTKVSWLLGPKRVTLCLVRMVRTHRCGIRYKEDVLNVKALLGVISSPLDDTDALQNPVVPRAGPCRHPCSASSHG